MAISKMPPQIAYINKRTLVDVCMYKQAQFLVKHLHNKAMLLNSGYNIAEFEKIAIVLLIHAKCCQIATIRAPWPCSITKFGQTAILCNAQLTTQ
jgi:hypothetical protein